jgi:hypothetical protein
LSTGDFSPITVDESYDEQEVAPASSLVTHQINGNFVEVIDVSAAWLESDTYGVYDPEGNFIEPYTNNLGFVDLVNSTLEYYGVPFEVVNRFEIGRYITPYGIGLTLDSDGWTWVFDVTDYAPLLQGMVELEAGNWQDDTLTEDMDLSYRIQLAGWRCRYLVDLVAPAEIPSNVNAFKSQQFRWAKGSIQTAKKLLPRILKTDISGFAKFQAFMHLTHYLIHPLMLFLAVMALPVLLSSQPRLPAVLFFAFGSLLVLSCSGPSRLYVVAEHALDLYGGLAADRMGGLRGLARLEPRQHRVTRVLLRRFRCVNEPMMGRWS